MAVSPFMQAARNKTTIIVFLLIAALLPLTGVGVFAGALLAVLVVVSLLLANDRDVVNRRLLLGLAALVLVVNLVFMAGFFGAFN